jgi:hypothetical protein
VLLIVPVLSLVSRGHVPSPLIVFTVLAVFLPTYLFCVTGVPRYAGWSLVGPMMGAYAWVVYQRVDELGWLGRRPRATPSDASLDMTRVSTP